MCWELGEHGVGLSRGAILSLTWCSPFAHLVQSIRSPGAVQKIDLGTEVLYSLLFSLLFLCLAFRFLTVSFRSMSAATFSAVAAQDGIGCMHLLVSLVYFVNIHYIGTWLTKHILHFVLPFSESAKEKINYRHPFL